MLTRGAGGPPIADCRCKRAVSPPPEDAEEVVMESRVAAPRTERTSADGRGRPSGSASEAARGPGFEQGIGLRTAVAINMTQMCGIGPFVTIPLMIATLGGPQAVFGWIFGALLALVDGLVWAELGAAMP